MSAPTRRLLLNGGVATPVLGLPAPLSARLAGCATDSGSQGPLLSFKAVPVSTADTVAVPDGYTAWVIAAWGGPVGLSSVSAAFRFDGGNSAGEQGSPFGMHHDGSHFFGHPLMPDSNNAGLLVMNHAHEDDGLQYPGGLANRSAAKVRQAQVAPGVSVVEVEARPGPGGVRWEVVRPNPLARRITASTPVALGGPAAGHALLRTAADPRRGRVLVTLNNCASDITPWVTFVTCG